MSACVHAHLETNQIHIYTHIYKHPDIYDMYTFVYAVPMRVSMYVLQMYMKDNQAMCVGRSDYSVSSIACLM